MLTTNSNSPDFVQLVDFGIAKMPAGDDEDGGHDLTRTGEIFGSPQYEPEQCSSMPMDARSGHLFDGLPDVRSAEAAIRHSKARM